VPYDSHELMTQALLSKKIDVIVAWMSYDHWRKRKLQGTIDNILLIDEYPIEMVTYIRKDWPELIPILNKALAALQQSDLPRIIDKWFGQWPQAYTATRVNLTQEESAWLDKKHTVQVLVREFPPFIFVKEGKEPGGISIDFLNLIAKRTGINFKYHFSTLSFESALEGMKNREGPDLITNVMRTPDREKTLSFSKDYLAIPRVIFTRADESFIANMDDLTGKTISVPRGTHTQEQIQTGYPGIKLQPFATDLESLKALSTGQADAYVGNLTLASYLIRQQGFTNLKVAAPSPFGDHVLSYGNRKDWPELSSIISKGLNSITPEEKSVIQNKYVAVRFEYGITSTDILKWILLAAGAISGIVLFFVVWNRQLSQKVKEQTSKIIDSESRFRATFEQAAVGVAHVSLEGRFLRLNEKFCEIVGYSEDEMRELTFQEITHPDDLDADLDFVQQVLKGAIENYSMDKRYYHKDGSVVWVNLTVSLVFDRGGQAKYFVSVIKEISVRKQAEEALRQSCDFQQHLNTTVPDAVFSVRMPERIIEWANDSFNVLGYESEECIGKSPEMLYATPEESQAVDSLLLDVIREGKDVLRTEALLRHKNGKVFTADINAAVYKENGEVVSVTALVRDISERKLAEKKLNKAFADIAQLQAQLKAESAYLQEEIKLEHNFENIIGNSNAIQYALFKVEQVAETNSTVLILGETGTGKELIARAIHHNSQRKDRPLFKLNCATLPPNLIENELFGHEKGSFTGAHAKHTGRFEIADGSSLFLDEIGELPIELQVKLLRVIEDGEFERLGSTNTLKVDVRIIAATNRDLEKDVKERRFRSDLWYRLNVFPITLPPLRDRTEDIPLIVQYYLEKFARKLGKDIVSAPQKVMKALQSNSWPGNVRELQNVIERAVIVTSGSKLQMSEKLKLNDKISLENFKSLYKMEREYIVKVLEKTGWKVSGKNSAAEILGLDRSTLRARMKKLDIQKP